MGRESIEKGGGLLNDPLLPLKRSDGSSGAVECSISSRDSAGRNENRSSFSSATTMVVVTSLVAVCGSYVFGLSSSRIDPLLDIEGPVYDIDLQIGYSSPAQSGISADLGLTVAEYSLFGSILTIGAMIGAIASGKIADYLGRRCVSWWLNLGRLLVGCGMGLPM
ncbi:hypothetical protein FEM48_Zijuj02G0151200 [Ziziphus jujuba var. spinosa]|uniref:Major facilitator superfamily (MFS) profile domain-containing protein n=1 Tax=Ziziphus jujuba var. spinosa TaxID=714518 RepID=A0A978VWE0_ZIZJJ|nr:hypothetical protein FEM48_Zijuj02G0151200 [Ziziphus jujuba var. spinosa]